MCVLICITNQRKDVVRYLNSGEAALASVPGLSSLYPVLLQHPTSGSIKGIYVKELQLSISVEQDKEA